MTISRYKNISIYFQIFFIVSNICTWRRSDTKIVNWSHIIASLSAQCRQVYCFVEMASSAPLRRPPRHSGEFDGFPGRRERPNQYRHITIFPGLSTYPTLRRNSRRRLAPSILSLNQPSRNLLQRVAKGQTRAEISSTSTTISILNPKMTEQWNWYRIVHWNPQSNFAEKYWI